MAKNQSRCVTLSSARESIVFLGKIAIANVKQSGGSLAHTNKLDRQPVECHLENSRKMRYQLIYQSIRKGWIQGLRPGSVVSLQASDILAREVNVVGVLCAARHEDIDPLET